jgi:hypothetical protein
VRAYSVARAKRTSFLVRTCSIFCPGGGAESRDESGVPSALEGEDEVEWRRCRRAGGGVDSGSEESSREIWSEWRFSWRDMMKMKGGDEMGSFEEG